MKKKATLNPEAGNWEPAVPKATAYGGVPRREAESALGRIHVSNLNELSDFEVSVPELWTRYSTPDAVFPQGCYDRSFLFVCKLSVEREVPVEVVDNLWLVHGEYMLGLGHAWVELPGGSCSMACTNGSMTAKPTTTM